MRVAGVAAPRIGHSPGMNRGIHTWLVRLLLFTHTARTAPFDDED
jgi:hypothetical protein